MSEANDFLAAIIANPADDLPRLVFADFLDEDDDHDRAEFIRVQCEAAARMRADDPEHIALAVREKQLLDLHDHEWKIPNFRGGQRFRRGFIEIIHTTADRLIEAAPRIFEFNPIRDLRVSIATQRLLELAAIEELGRIETLDLSNNYLEERAASEFFRRADLRSLSVMIARNCRIWPDTLRTIARLPRQWTAIDLSGNPLGEDGDDGFTILAESPTFASVVELTVRGDEQNFEVCGHASAAAAIAASKTLTKLRKLDLRGQYIGDSGLSSLVNSPNAGTLEELDVASNDLGSTGESAFENLAASPNLGRLTRLSIGGHRNFIDRRAAYALATWARLPRLEFVDLRRCEFGPGARAEIQHSPWADRFLCDEAIETS